MNWYSAHIIMFVEFKTGPQPHYPVWENIILISARTEEDAFKKAERHGRAEEGDDEGSFRWGKKPARWVFAGIRKLTECQSPLERPDDGTELSYNELEFASRDDIKKFAEGKPVDARFNDRFAAKDVRSVRGEPSRARKRPA